MAGCEKRSEGSLNGAKPEVMNQLMNVMHTAIN